jgi:colicin import membrane protein
MSIKKNLVAAGLLVALTGAVIGCSTATDTATKAVDGAKDATGKAVEGAKDATGKAVDGAKDTTSKAVDGAKDATGKAVDGVKGGGLAALVSQAKAPLTIANGDIKKGNMEKAKEQFGKFETLWATVGPQIKPLAGAKYDTIDSSVKKLSGIMGASTIDKTKASEALTSAIKAMDSASAKK